MSGDPNSPKFSGEVTSLISGQTLSQTNLQERKRLRRPQELPSGPGMHPMPDTDGQPFARPWAPHSRSRPQFPAAGEPSHKGSQGAGGGQQDQSTEMVLWVAVIKDSSDEHWPGCGEAGTPVHCGWPRNPVQLLQRPGRQVLGERKGRRGTRRFRSCDRPGGVKTRVHTKACACTAARFTTAERAGAGVPRADGTGYTSGQRRTTPLRAGTTRGHG